MKKLSFEPKEGKLTPEQLEEIIKASKDPEFEETPVLILPDPMEQFGGEEE